MAKATITTNSGKSYSLEIESEVGFKNEIRRTIENKQLYEFKAGDKCIILNPANIDSIELDWTKPKQGHVAQLVTPEVTPDELRKRQEAMQPEIHMFEAKAKAMEDMKKKEDADKAQLMSKAYSKVSGKSTEIKEANAI